MIFDSHAHYDDESFNEDREIIINQLKENGIGTVINVSSSMETIKTTLKLADTYDFIYASVGVHPSDTRDLNDEQFKEMKKMAMHKKCVAIGEIGLDYYWDEPERTIQKKWFEKQLCLAEEMKLPVIVHSRDAAKDTYDILKEFTQIENIVIHCYSYSREMAEKFMELGYYFGVGGVITFKNAKKLRESVEIIPMDKLLIETDCPYLSPEPYRGKRNSSLNLCYVAEKIAKLKGISTKEVIEITEKNAKKFYRMEKE